MRGMRGASGSCRDSDLWRASSYTVYVDADPIESDTRHVGTGALTILAPPDPGQPTTAVTAIYPTAASIPYNQLRLYVYFSAPMSDGAAAEPRPPRGRRLW